MLLIVVIRQLEVLPSEKTIYAMLIDGQWAEQSEAVVIGEPDDDFTFYIGPDEAHYEYLLEVVTAHDVIGAYKELHYVSQPSAEEMLKTIVYYAEHDCYLPPARTPGYIVNGTPGYPDDSAQGA